MTRDFIVITNRAAGGIGDGEWVHIVPEGQLSHGESGIVQVLDDVAIASIMRNFRRDKERLGEKWPGLYIGEEHHYYDEDKSSAALGWAKEFQKRADGIWAKPEWTDLGRTAVANRRFKFTSFVADRSDLQSLGGNRYRVLKVETVGLTNNANGREMLTPIANRGTQTTTSTDKRAHPGISLATAYQMAQREAARGGSSAGTIQNRAASTPEKIKALCNMVFEAGRGSANFNAGWDRVMRDHPALFEELGFKIEDDENQQ